MAQIRVSNKTGEVRPQVPRFAIGCVDAPVVVHVCAVQPTIHFSLDDDVQRTLHFTCWEVSCADTPAVPIGSGATMSLGQVLCQVCNDRSARYHFL
jgi:hypothetical protein